MAMFAWHDADMKNSGLQKVSKRSVFIAWSTKKFAKSMIFGTTGADLIYCKNVDHGVVYVIKYKSENQKLHMTVDNYIKGLDDLLKERDKTHSTFFRSINDGDPRSSKVLSFEGGSRKQNYLYRKLFDKKDRVLPGVIVWTPENVDSSTEEEDSDDENDSEDEAIEPTNPGKKRARPDSEDRSKKAKLHPPADDEGCSSVAGEDGHRDEVLFHLEKTKELESELKRVNGNAEAYRKEAEEYTASLQKESEAELKRVKEEALASEQRLLQESETKLNECKKEAEENKASLQKESEAELKRVKEDALASEQRLLQESESKLERVERDAEERLNKCKEEYNQCLAKSESELTKIKGEVATHRENAINYETQYEEYKERMEDPYNEEGVEYYKKQFREKMRAISRADYNEVQVSICDRHCKYLGKKVEECENFHEPKIERLEKMVSVIIIII